MDKSIAEKIRDLRKKHGLSQDEFGSRIGVSRQAVSKWELGTWPDTENLGRICKEFDVSITYFFGDDENACKKAAEELAATKSKSEPRIKYFALKILLSALGSIVLLLLIVVGLINIVLLTNKVEVVYSDNWRLTDATTWIIILIIAVFLFIYFCILFARMIRRRIKQNRDKQS